MSISEIRYVDCFCDTCQKSTQHKIEYKNSAKHPDNSKVISFFKTCLECLFKPGGAGAKNKQVLRLPAELPESDYKQLIMVGNVA